ncbi:hypothetical protein [Cellulomonas soli]
MGAGLAATQTVAALRAHGFDGHVRVLGAEASAPYDRPRCPSTCWTAPPRRGSPTSWAST